MSEALYRQNLELGRTEYLLQNIHVRSRPRIIGIVLGNACNLRCVHCYQPKNGDKLAHGEIGRELRRELSAFYPYLSTLDVLGGEVFLNRGFSELIDDVAAVVERPVLRITTNGTLLDDEWVQRIVDTPFLRVTISIDGATPATYRRLRCGGELETVLDGIRRLQELKQQSGSEYPYLDSQFVIMRSNFREIPRYLELMESLGVHECALETVRVGRENAARGSEFLNEVIREKDEIAELHAILRDALIPARERFRMIRVSGLSNLFLAQGLDASFLREGGDGLYPESDDLRPESGSFELCPNPWTTLFITEAGNVHICFLAEPIGNIYETPLAEIWNSPRAVAARSRIVSGHYRAAKCSEQSCSWREGQRAEPPTAEEVRSLLSHMKTLTACVDRLNPEPSEAPALASVRRLVAERDRIAHEWEALFRELCDTNAAVHERGQRYIDELETRLREELIVYNAQLRQSESDRLLIAELAARADRDRRRVAELEAMVAKPLVRLACRASRVIGTTHT